MGDSDATANSNVAAPTGSRAAEVVHFARQARTDYRKNKVYAHAENVAGRVRMVVYVLGIAIIVAGAHFLAGANLGSPLIWSVLLFISVPLVLWSRVSRWRLNRRWRSTLPLMPPKRCRLCCIGSPEQLTEHGEWADVPFEPALFFGKFTIQGRGASRSVYLAVSTLAWLVGSGLVFYRFGIQSTFTTSYITGSLGIILAEIVTAFFWPIYLRLVPGRLDVIGYGPLSRKPVFVDRYDLRRATIMADLTRSFVSITTPNGSIARKLEFGIALMSERRKFVYMLFLAAMSSYQPGPLPKDDLVG